MNRKNLVVVMGVLLGIWLLSSTCGVALADPPFYVKINNRTGVAVDFKYNWTEKGGGDPSGIKSCTIPSMSTKQFTSPRGNPMMHVWMNGGDGDKHYQLKGGENPQQPPYYAIYNEGNTEGGYIRIK